MTTLHEFRVWSAVLISCVGIGASLLPLTVYTTYRQREGQDANGAIAALAGFCLLAIGLIVLIGLFATANAP